MQRWQALTVAMVSTVLLALAGGAMTAQERTPPAEPGEFALPEGITREPLALDVTETLPAAPAAMEMLRFTFAPGAVMQLPAESPSTALVYVEAGTLTARVDAPVTVTRATVGGARVTIAVGTEYIAETGDFFIGPAYVGVEARNDGTEPLALLMAVIQPAAGMAEAATPEP